MTWKNNTFICKNGLDTKTNEKLVTDHLLEAENITFGETGSYSKRFGTKEVAELSQGSTLASFNNTLVAFSGDSVHSIAGDAVVDHGGFVNTSIRSEIIIRDEGSQSNPSYGVSEDVEVFAYIDDPDADTDDDTSLYINVVKAGVTVRFKELIEADAVNPQVYSIW